MRVAWMDCVSRVLHDACADAVANRARAHGNRGDCHDFRLAGGRAGVSPICGPAQRHRRAAELSAAHTAPFFGIM